MKITRTSLLTGITRTMEIAISEKHYLLWRKGKILIKNITPSLSESDREFIMTGVTDEEWKTIENFDD